MSRAVVFKTRGKLDLRSITVFGMNAKPTTTTPIGYFGTGLKYAVAVLSREKIPVTFWIEGKKWVVERDPTSFRGKEFTELYICSTTIGGLIKKRIKLPFTTELGKNWELWQAFRELESNTRDEKGESYVVDDPYDVKELEASRHTYIVVEGEEFVQEYFDREKTFLPEGMTERNSSERVQCFARKSNYIYYRSIRIMDLKEPSENTYNLLCPIELTEDRTAKSLFAVEYEIEGFLANSADPSLISRALVAPEKSYERKLTYAYSAKSETFNSIVATHLDQVNPTVAASWRDTQPKPKEILHPDWRVVLHSAIERGDRDLAWEMIDANRESMKTILHDHIENNPYESDVELPVGTDEPTVQKESKDDDDHIPF